MSLADPLALLQERFPSLDLRRRDVLKTLGATLALAGLDGCGREADETAMPFVEDPDGGPGAEKHYATAVELDGIGQPVIGICRDGRPVKLEGNPAHPASLGATDAFTQAALLGLYDPARSATPLRQGAPATWGEAEAALFQLARRLDEAAGGGFHLLTGPVGSPTLLRQIAELRASWPAMRWHVHAPLAGTVPQPVLPLDKVEALVALDSDPLGAGPLQTIHARGWSARRRAYQEGKGDALLFVAEPVPTLTGVSASERLIARHGRIPALLAGLAEELDGGAKGGTFDAREQAWLQTAVAELRRHRNAALILLGAHHPPPLHEQVAALNAAIAAPRPLGFAAVNPDAEDLTALVAAMRSGEAQAVFVLDSNPAYSAPPDLGFRQAFAKVPLRLHAGPHADETAALAHWHLPLAHPLESWSDVRAADGSAGIVQPLVRPFLDVRSRHEVLALLAGDRSEARALVQASWNATDDDARWQDALLRGSMKSSSLAGEGGAPTGADLSPDPLPHEGDAERGLDLVILPDPTVHDGQFAHNPWLQELPKPLTKLTWDNAIHIGPTLAARLGLENERRAELSVGQARVVGPVWIVPGIADETVLVHLGYGRRAGGQVGEGMGFDAYQLRSSASPWRRAGARLRALDGSYPLATTQPHTTMAGHDFVKFVGHAGEGVPKTPPKPNMYPPQPRTDGLAWGMAIDLDVCIGCNACVTACVAENNIPMVGKDQVHKGREMHWLRVDHYADGPSDDPQHAFQPVPCMHCEDAPCEMGCPVNATVHSPDGLNLQVYNRCIGTRTCSAYCPYKVRRFNWLDYTREDPPVLRAARNPEVTVRDRGVMEKCTYCIQRIEREKIGADAEGRPMGEVKTACQQVCPTNAIVFGNLADGSSEVSRRKADPRDYALLEEANTRPRTTYFARIRKGRKA
uniref:4Fe-4S dicluster domain-containing protein n=1 Tax=Altererythrobacter segetis TaxID=1104773 RepID=UPI0014078C69|nr:4Fe-4S dicluster domain-containing protein [Altererythrobacter segetis]